MREKVGMMMKRSAQLFWALCLLVMITPGVGSGQTVGGGGDEGPTATMSAPPAEKFAISPGGVDMRTGYYAYKGTDLSVGPADSGLTLSRTLNQDVFSHTNPFANFSHNWDILLTEKRIDIFQQIYTYGYSGPDYEMGVHFGGRAQTFRRQAAYSGFDLISRDGYGLLTWTGTADSASAVYTYTAADGTVILFRAMGSGDCATMYRCAYASTIIQPDGTLLTLTYDSASPGTVNSTRLRSVTSSRGYALMFEYSGGGTNVSKACVLNLVQAPMPTSGSCPATASATSYTYTTFNGQRLASVTDPAGATANYTYATVSGSFKMGFINPGETTPWMTNSIQSLVDGDGFSHEGVGYQSFADGNIYNYTFDTAPEQDGVFPVVAGGSYIDGLGHTTIVAYDFPIKPGSGGTTVSKTDYQTTEGPVTITDALGRTTTNHYCDPNAEAGLPTWEHHRCLVTALQWTIDPEGIKYVYSYDSLLDRNITQIRRIAKPGSGLVDIVTSATYNCTYRPSCNKPTSTTDANGNVKTFTYDTTHGGVLTETGPAVTVVKNDGTIVTGAQPVKRYTYVQRYTWVSDGAGGYVHGAAGPIWLLSTVKTCRTSATVSGACSGGSADEVTTTYDYGPDSGPSNLWLRGTVVTADGISLRTCYGYDAKGRKISETSPRAGLTVCS